jgi:hypothetical protein
VCLEKLLVLTDRSRGVPVQGERRSLGELRVRPKHRGPENPEESDGSKEHGKNARAGLATHDSPSNRDGFRRIDREHGRSEDRTTGE